MNENDDKKELEPSLPSELKYDFQNDLNEIGKEIEVVDELYNELKSHYDTVKNYKPKKDFNIGNDEKPINTFSFLHQQARNLIDLKSTKVSLITARVNVKKVAAELYLKKRALDNSNTSEQEKLEAAIIEVIQKERDARSEKPLLVLNTKRMIFDNTELDEKVGNIDIAENKIPTIKDLYPTFDRVVIIDNGEKNGSEKKLVAIDSDYNIIENYPINKKDFFFDGFTWFDSKTGEELEEVESFDE
jgi:hypothetical protein